MFYTKGMKILSLHCKEGLFTPEKWDMVLPSLVHIPTNVLLGHKITEYQPQCLSLSCSEKWNQMLADMIKFAWLHLCIKYFKHAHSPLSSFLLPQPGYKLGNTEVSISCHRMKQDIGDQVFLTFSTVLQSSKDGWEPKKENTINGHSYHFYAMFLPEIPGFYETWVHNEQ